MISAIILLPFLYILPGYFFSFLFCGKLRRSPFFYLFLSFLVVPIFYTFLVTFKILSLTNFLIIEALFASTCFVISRKIGEQKMINLDNVAPPFSLSPLIVLISVSFFMLVMSPRLGLWQGYFPIGDDQHQIRKIVSVAESPNEPLFYHFPTTRLTIYYFNNVAPGLLTKFSGNFVKANQSWFIHVGLQTALILWLIVRVAGSLLKNNTQRLIFLFGVTYFSGLEFFLYKIKGIGYVDQLEWWSDWFFPQSKIHMQISNPFNLFFWVPQHLFAALLVFLIFIFISKAEKHKSVSKLFLALLWANILGNSAFVFLSTSLVYGLYTITVSAKAKSLKPVFYLNFPIIIFALLLSAKNLELFLTAEKGHYFVTMANVFWFVPNSGTLNKIINLGLTVPLYLLVEFGVLFPILVYSLIRFVKDRIFRERYLFFYLFIFIFPVIFFVKSLDDNNVSMRSFIPVQISLALFFAEFIGSLRLRKRWLFFCSFIFLALSLPSGFFDFGLRFREQFNPRNEQEKLFYKLLDERLPLNSIVFSSFSQADAVTALGHRFTFKDPNLFSATDNEHTARSQVKKYEGLNFFQEESIAKVLGANLNLKNQFKFYSLRPLSGYGVSSGDSLFNSGGLKVYPVLFRPDEIKF